MKKISLFNHKGGVGKTTLTVNLAQAFADLGYTVLLVDADPQCNLTSFYLSEKQLEQLLGESGEDEGNTLWSAVMPVTYGRGAVKTIAPYLVGENIHLLAGDVLLSIYEEELSSAWTDAFARKVRGYDVMCALARTVNAAAAECGADVVLYDVGPNIGPLNRAVLLDCDCFVTPVAADLFSLRALTTVGRSIAKWIQDWETVRTVAPDDVRDELLPGRPQYLGYITSAFKVHKASNAANPHDYWESKIAPRVRDKIIEDLKHIDAALIPHTGNKVGGVKHFHSLAPKAQELGLAIGSLRGHVNGGHNAQIEEAQYEFDLVAREIAKRAGI
ncbi:ParA family protein [Ralstonia sp. L16]|uniref:ParA family protein n=1 Tax=Ralstonia sp. L16 TaxID=3423950 RepID=UPI003F7A17FC